MEPSQSSGAGTERIAAFSDGVIAIIITIMVLELKLPEAAAGGDLWANFIAPLAPKLAAYALSFFVVGTLWVNHHHLLAAAPHATAGLMWWNLLVLFCLSLIPLATGFLGEHPGLPRAVTFYALVLATSSVSFSILRHVVAGMPGRNATSPHIAPATLKRSLLGSALYFVAAGLAPLFPTAALVLLVVAPVMFNVPLIAGWRKRS